MSATGVGSVLSTWPPIMSSGQSNKADALPLEPRLRPPECLRPPSACDLGAQCNAQSASPFHALEPQPSFSTSLEESTQLVKRLRVLAFEGHVGPWNDMVSFLMERMGMLPSQVSYILFGQGDALKQHLDKRIQKYHNQSMLGSGQLIHDLLNYLIRVDDASDQPTMGRQRKSREWGGSHTAPGCEVTGKCLHGIFREDLRRDFAARYGAHIARNIDVVTCNFPSWQCGLFEYVNVTVLMRFTHRFDHHLQGKRVTDFDKSTTHMLAAMAAHRPWRHLTLSQAVSDLLLRMARKPNAIFAVSNAYDYVYLRRQLFASSPPQMVQNIVPWPGTSIQLSRLEYTGSKPQVLFCCGNHPYNEAISWFSSVIRNTSAALSSSSSSSSASSASSSASASPKSPQFSWLADIYPPPSSCSRRVVQAPPTEDGVADARTLKSKVERVCGYDFGDVVDHPLAVLLPYSLHSYGLVQMYSMGVPLVAPSLRLLSELHVQTAMVSHKVAGNIPWRLSAQRARRVPGQVFHKYPMRSNSWYVPDIGASAPCCQHDPNDACDTQSAAAWLQFADWYQWPHISYFDTPSELIAIVNALLANETRRFEISTSMRRFFEHERQRTEKHARSALVRADSFLKLQRIGFS